MFTFDGPVQSRKRYKRLYRALAWQFKAGGIHVDPACKDALRLFFGSAGCDVWPNWATLPVAEHNPLIDAWKRGRPAKRVRGPVKEPNEIGSAYWSAVSRGVIDKLASAKRGERHPTILREAYKLGGYVGYGYIDRADAQSWLESGTSGWDERVKHVTDNAIVKSLDAGIAKPYKIRRRSEQVETVAA